MHINAALVYADYRKARDKKTYHAGQDDGLALHETAKKAFDALISDTLQAFPFFFLTQSHYFIHLIDFPFIAFQQLLLFPIPVKGRKQDNVGL